MGDHQIGVEQQGAGHADRPQHGPLQALRDLSGQQGSEGCGGDGGEHGRDHHGAEAAHRIEHRQHQRIDGVLGEGGNPGVALAGAGQWVVAAVGVDLGEGVLYDPATSVGQRPGLGDGHRLVGRER